MRFKATEPQTRAHAGHVRRCDTLVRNALVRQVQPRSVQQLDVAARYERAGEGQTETEPDQQDAR